MANYLVRGLHHIGINTDDLQKSCDFYIEHLGFRMLYKKQLANCSCWFVENHGLVLEFISVGNSEPGGPVAHIAIEVLGIDALVDELKAKGVIPQETPIDTLDGFFPRGSRNIFFRGPSGEEVELFELNSQQ